jgi:hypothetical protein
MGYYFVILEDIKNNKVINCRKERMDITEKIQKMSHSGATLRIEKNKELGFFVNKRIEDNVERNYNATIKQKTFESLITSCYQIQSIPIQSLQKNNSGLSICMPYIEGITGEQFAINGNRLLASKLKTTLSSYIINIWANSEVQEFDFNIILEKLEQIESFNYEDDIANAVLSACKYVRKECVKNWYIPIGTCHGDLTLSNIIITQDNKMYLFDFLDSYIESPLQDVAKLIQDFDYGWSFRNARSSVRLKAQMFCFAAYPAMINTIKVRYKTELNIIEIMTIIRIAPYLSKDDLVTRKWLIKSISDFLKKALK